MIGALRLEIVFVFIFSLQHWWMVILKRVHIIMGKTLRLSDETNTLQVYKEDIQKEINEQNWCYTDCINVKSARRERIKSLIYF